MNQTSIPEDLISSATSLWLEMKETGAASLRLEMNESSACDGGVSKVSERVLQFLDRDELLECILEVFEECYEIFLQTKDLSGLMNEYNSWLVSLDKEVKVLDPKGEFTGISKGINEKGELLVELPSGEVTEIYAGEVSVRGLYGYV